jgi:hypothetical protein
MRQPKSFIDYDGTILWYIDGKCHRLDGPAIENANGYKAWYIDNKNYKTQEEHAIAAFLWMNEHERA